MASCNCAVGSNGPEVQEFVETSLNANRPYRAICAEVEEKFKVRLYPRALTAHKAKHMSAADNPVRVAIQQLREELEAEMVVAPPMVRALFLVVIKNIEGLEDTKTSVESLIKAVQALNGILGNGSDRDALAHFSLRAVASRRERAQVGNPDEPTPDVRSMHSA